MNFLQTSALKTFALFLLLCAALCIRIFPAAAQQKPSTYSIPEAGELNAFYIATNGPGWGYQSGWPIQFVYTQNTQPSIFGIRFENSTSNIYSAQSLNLRLNTLKGNIPNLKLPNLRVLDLSQNYQLSGTIPNFSNLPNLRGLDLSVNQLTGTIPNFNNLQNLEFLYLGQNQLSGNISNFNNLQNLRGLDLNRNKLTGTIPNFSNIQNVQSLSLSYNQLTGTIPNFNNLQNIESLYLNGNQLTGTIPNFNNLQNVRYLDLSGNRLTGTIPNFNNLQNVRYLDLSGNRLTGTIPNFNNLQSLESLWLPSNQLTGAIPNFNLPELADLLLSGNQLQGINIDWAKLPKLKVLHLDFNKFVFRDLEPAAKVMRGKEFFYAPQDSVETFLRADTVSVDVGGDSTRYQWYKNGQPIRGATQSFYKITDNALYSCHATNSLLPLLTLYSRPVRGTITSVRTQPEPAQEFSVHPNPSDGAITIAYSLAQRTVVRVEIISLLGETILTVVDGVQAAGTYSLPVNLQSRPSGVYGVQLQVGSEKTTRRFHLIR